ncbi:MAG: MBL fold metallo-hydrolase [Thermodesulfovibrionales bacterium]
MNKFFDLPIRAYEMIRPPSGEILLKFSVYLDDRPGSLADFASAISLSNGNIGFFHYDRSSDSSRVAVEVQVEGRERMESLLGIMRERGYSFERTQDSRDAEVGITSLASILEVKVRLEHRPGTLAGFAQLLRERGANVIYMLFDEAIDPESADIAMAVRDVAEVDSLLQAINEKGYHYRVVYRGSDEEEAEQVIGLKLVEKFFLRLRRILGEEDLTEMRSLIASSHELSEDLIRFASEAGANLEAGEVFEKILTLASRSRSSTGERFAVREMPPLQLGDVTLYSFRLPTTENIFVFKSGSDLFMVDAGYGIYYEDIKRLFREKGMDPSQLRRIFITHPDADHMGSADSFSREFGTEVVMHPGSRGVMEHGNRAYGASGRLFNLNKYYTRLISRFTESGFSGEAQYFSPSEKGRVGAFRIIDAFSIGSLSFDVLESHGGHIPGQVFFMNRDYGLLFSSDYLINIQSLSADEREILGVYRYLLTSPNSDSRIYKEESAGLKEIAQMLDEEMKGRGKRAVILPGHGDAYSPD